MNLTPERIAEIETLAAPRRTSHRRKPGTKDYKYYGFGFNMEADEPEGSFMKYGSPDDLAAVYDCLEKLGWKIGLDPRIEKDYKCLSDGHRLATNGDLRLKIEIGRIVNFKWYAMYGCDPGREEYDTKYETMKYLDKKRIDLLVKKVSELLFGLGYKDVSENEHLLKNAREKIEYRMRACWHFKAYDTNSGRNPSLSEPYGSRYNGKDASGKDMSNGDVKYFVDWYGRVKRGTVYYNLNNMWWVLVNNDSFTNISTGQLFDTLAEAQDAAPKSDAGSGAKRALEKALKDDNQYKVKILRDLLWKLNEGKPGEDQFLIQCKCHEDGAVLWWAWNSSGYTTNLEYAGRYTFKEAYSICTGDRGEKMFLLQDAHLAKATPQEEDPRPSS